MSAGLAEMAVLMTKTILVVDDEKELANTLSAILRHAGYNALVAYSSAEALEKLRTTAIDLLVSDVVMPGMNGMELAMAADSEHPNLRILLMSGNAATQQIVDDAGTNVRQFELLAKPVPPTQILAHIKSLLSKAA